VTGGRVVVPVMDSGTLRRTVGYAAEEAVREGRTGIHFVYLASWRSDDPQAGRRRRAAEELLDRIEAWARTDIADAAGTDAGGASSDDAAPGDPEGTTAAGSGDADGGEIEGAPTVAGVSVVTAILGEDRYLFGPSGYVDRILAYADAHGIDDVIVDPGYTIAGSPALLHSLEFELAGTRLTVTEAPVSRPTRRVRFVQDVSAPRFLAVFLGAFGFYLLLGDPTYWFDLVTGGATGLITAILLSRTSLDDDPTLRETPRRLLRMGAYVPALLFEIVKANVQVAAVILHPRLPIEPRMTRISVLVGSGFPITTLANSITLTPGTLTVRARDRDLFVHSLLPASREGLFAGALERWTRFVFYGRRAARIPTPEERGDCAVLQGPEADEPLADARADGGGRRPGGPTGRTEGDGRGSDDGEVSP